MAKERWVKLYEDMLDNKLWRLPLLDRCIAILLLLKAKWSDYDYPTESGYIIHLKRGQLVATWTWLAENIGVDGISRRNIRTVMEHLSNIGFLDHHTDHQLTIITICNYEIYQSNGKNTDQLSDQLPTNYRPTTDQLPTTDKEVKEIKKVKKEKKTTKDLPPKDELTTKEEVIEVVNKEFKWLVDYWNEYAPEPLKIVQVPRDFDRSDVFACRALLLKIKLTHEQIRVAIINWFTKDHWYSQQNKPASLSLRQWLAKDNWVREMASLKSNGTDKRSAQSRRLASNYGDCEDDAPLAEA